ncbi:MAG: galactitol-1-phosphate 5-dehydrogenase [Chloroflexi bacterium]|nr:galactitol-1-phosphate 5-dehydrogenase [Chloroflexota bacterium]
MKALMLHAIGDLRLEQVPMPQPRESEALIRVAAAGICGSDLPRIYEHGTYRFPLIPGHELAGTIAEINGSSDLHPGQAVAIKPLIACGECAYCRSGNLGQCVDYDYLGSRRDGGFAEYVCAPLDNLVPVPEGVPLIEATLCEPAAVALHALHQGDIRPGDVVAILGTGPIGMLLAQWSWYCGASQVILADIDQAKLELAESLTLGITVNSRTSDPIAAVRAASHGQRGADLVIEAAGAAITVAQAIEMARPLGTVVLMGNPSGDVALSQALVSQILRKQLTLRGTWNSNFGALPVDEWQLVLDAAARRRICLGPMISHAVPLEQGPETLEMMHQRREFYTRVVLTNP